MKYFIIAILVLTLNSCSSSDVENVNNIESYNHMKIDNIEYPINRGFIVEYGQNSDHFGYDNFLVLLSPGLTIETGGQGIPSLSGRGTATWIDLYSTESGVLDSGEYFYSGNIQEYYPIKSFSRLFFNDINIIEYDIGYEANGGKINISKNGNEYIVIIDGNNVTEEDGGDFITDEFIGYFKGALPTYDEFDF